jgi:HK97 gp10 family phage protein
VSFSVSFKPINLDKIVKQLEKVPEKQDKALLEALGSSVVMIHADAVKSIYAHESKGVTYTRGSVEHTASKPGFPPNSDTGTLARGIRWEVDSSKNIGFVGTNVKHGSWMEFGTRDVAPRPWLFPAYLKNLKNIISNFEEAVKKALK